MAFVVVLFRGEEVTRRELSGPVVIGGRRAMIGMGRDITLRRRTEEVVFHPAYFELGRALWFEAMRIQRERVKMDD